MKAYLTKTVRLLTTFGYDSDTIAKILGVSVDTVKEFIPIINKGGSHNGFDDGFYKRAA